MEGEIEADKLREAETDSLVDNEGLPDLLVEVGTLELWEAETLSDILGEAESEFQLV